MKVPPTILAKLGLSCMLTGQVGILAGLWAWSRQTNGSEWATRTVVLALAGSGAGLYFAGRAIQMAARRKNAATAAKPPEAASDSGAKGDS